jgi:hypothetical protein
MSEQEESQILYQVEAIAKLVSKVVPLFWVLIVAAFGFGGWVVTIQLTATGTRKDIEAVKKTTDDIEKKVIAQDKRIQHVEDGQVNVLKTLDRIENKL